MRSHHGAPRLLRAPTLLLALVLVLASSLFPIFVESATAAIPASPITHLWVEPSSGYGFVDAAIASASRSIVLSIYELKDASVEQSLIAAARRGVNVRVLLNAAYLGRSENAAAYATLSTSRVKVAWAPSDQIFHAKYFVVDASRAYIGTGNLVPADYANTRDFWVEDTNPPDVRAITQTFSADFSGNSGAGVSSHGLVWSPGSTASLVGLIGSARHQLLVENEEMNNYAIESALANAAHRGVNVKIVMTQDSSWTNALSQLAAAGVHVSLLSSSQVYIHAKAICADCTNTSGVLFLGSENFSTSSLSYNRELGVITTGMATIHSVAAALAHDYAQGQHLSTSSGGSLPSGSPSGSGHVAISNAPGTIIRGSYASLSIHTTKAGQSCTLSVTLPSGYQSHASGLGRETTNGAGNATWSWRIGTSTDPGTATASVSCSTGSTRKTFTITS
jgi:cardiolipin synthase A/B